MPPEEPALEQGESRPKAENTPVQEQQGQQTVNPVPEIKSNTIKEEKTEKLPIPQDIVSRLYQALEARKYHDELPLVIKEGTNKTLFEAIPGKEPKINTVTPEQVSLLQKAIQEPEGLNGSVRIYVGKEKVFHVKDGEVVADKLGLVRSQARVQDNAQQVVSSKQVQQAKPIQGETPQSLQDQIKSLQTTVESQQKQIDELNQKLDKFANSPVFFVATGDTVGNWLNDLHSKIHTAGQEAVKQVSENLEQNKASLISKARQFFAGVKENVTDTLHAASNAVQTKASEVALGAMNAAAVKLAPIVGEKTPDGTVVVESRTLNQRLEVNGNSVALKERPQQDHQALWNKYGQGLPEDRPVLRTKLAVVKALEDGQTRKTAEDMISAADPQFGKIRDEYGLDRAVQYAKQTVRSAIRLEPSLGSTELPANKVEQRRNQNNSLQQQS